MNGADQYRIENRGRGRNGEFWADLCRNGRKVGTVTRNRGMGGYRARGEYVAREEGVIIASAPTLGELQQDLQEVYDWTYQ